LYDVNPNIRVVDSYINATQKIAHECLIDGYVWNASPCHILRGEGCPKCAGHIKKTHEEYVEAVSRAHPTIEVVGRYINSKTKILHRCTIDNHQWATTPNRILRGRGCPKCANNQRRTHEEYVAKLSVINPYIEVAGEYVNAITKITHRCLKCGMDFATTPYLTLKGCGCRCDGLSHGERFITQYLRYNKIDFIPQYRFDGCRDIYPLPFDFYIVKSGSCIEYDGEQHFLPSNKFGGEERLKVTQEHDKIKTQYCLDNNIALLRISYKDNIGKCLNDFFKIQND
jgi:predicted  nucleic acid-binding Zn-ribbon protein